MNIYFHKQPTWQRIMVLATRDTVHGANVSRLCRRRGWRVYAASTGTEIRRLVHKHGPIVVVMDTDLTEETGWLTCEKIKWEQSACRVVLLSDSWSEQETALADFVGADALVLRLDGPEAVLREMENVALPAAC